MKSLFSKIIDGEIPAYKVAETDRFLAFLDISPVTYGHLLCIPKKEIDYIFEMGNESYTELMLFSKMVAIALKKAVPCKKVGMSVVGLEVPHAHVHLIPINAVADMSFSNPRLKLSPEEFQELSERIQKEF